MNISIAFDLKFLQLALREAQQALQEGNNPVGTIIVNHIGEIIAQAHNQTKTLNDATAHGEILCISAAGELVLERVNPQPTTLYTTLEPCFACSFFITRTNIKRVVWALNDPYKGGMLELAESGKMKDDFQHIEMIAQPFVDMREDASKLMQSYYLLKQQPEVAAKFI